MVVARSKTHRESAYKDIVIILLKSRKLEVWIKRDMKWGGMELMIEGEEYIKKKKRGVIQERNIIGWGRR